MVEIQDLEKFNPWWKTGRMREDWLKPYKRRLFFEVEKYLEKKQINMIWGLRRTGKTTILHQIIDLLLKSTNAKNILYFSFDEIVYDVKDVLESYQKLILNKTFEDSKRLYIFLDEVQKVNDWENKLKVYYDLYPKIKFFISGSASSILKKRSKESLAGRVLEFLLKPLSFGEFLEMNNYNLKKIKENLNLWKRDLLPLFHRYLKYGSFPELATEEDQEFSRKYILNNVIERIVYKDIPTEFDIRDLELLKTLVYLIGKRPGMVVDYRELSKDLGKDQRTIANYFEYLEFSLLIKFVFNYRGSPLASMRKLKKVYFSTANIAFAFGDENFPFMFENLIASETEAKFFYKNSFEVDFIIPENNQLIAIEVKTTEKDSNQLKKFIEKFKGKVKKTILIDTENEGKENHIEIVPAWKFLLENKLI